MIIGYRLLLIGYRRGALTFGIWDLGFGICRSGGGFGFELLEGAQFGRGEGEFAGEALVELLGLAAVGGLDGEELAELFEAEPGGAHGFLPGAGGV